MKKMQSENKIENMVTAKDPSTISLETLMQNSLRRRFIKMLGVHPQFTEAVTSLQPVEQEKIFDTRSFQDLTSILQE